ncbi:hypothetical protein [Fructobacillus parabroussonetiae]|uniref:Uncharacterized protein n=1 Tax=Fructobacillus parabroussonetiae TaxID=2713174 RepID=A0ABS5QWN1_9LACO|nr:hypothetical protein [Fructobacillus parabroussonetiae]MBS9337342.1 hypothetical protein [Fructobacillus parabroussonetiae]
MLDKKFNQIDMLESFTLPVIVTGTLKEINGIQGVSSEKSASGIIMRENGKTTLEINDYPIDQNSSSQNGEVKFVDSDENGGIWYARSWNGELNFVIRKYLCTGSGLYAGENQFGAKTSKWEILDFSIQKKLPEKNEFDVAEIDITNLKFWFKIFRISQELSDVPTLDFKNLIYKNKKFTLKIIAKKWSKTERYSLNKRVSLVVKLFFEERQSRAFIFDLSTTIRNFFQIVMGDNLGIQKILLNKSDKDENGEMITDSDNAENWFASQSVLSEEDFSEKNQYPINYFDIKDN